MKPTLCGQNLAGDSAGRTIRWQKLELRPVEVQGKRHLQFSFFDAKQNIVKNYVGETAVSHLTDALNLPFRNFHIITQKETIQINLSKKGKAIINRKATEKPQDGQFGPRSQPKTPFCLRARIFPSSK